ncbi:hypothetical protein SAMN04515647_1594 [Cohaesibacter sp. ES.047]|nr:hypothetical protein SAMN04515647_1594 [Cohaesibacter sp. ES.047]
MEPNLEQMAGDEMTRIVADGVKGIVDRADGATEQAVLLQLVCTTALFGLSETLTPAMVANWLRGLSGTFDRLSAVQRGELN